MAGLRSAAVSREAPRDARAGRAGRLGLALLLAAAALLAGCTGMTRSERPGRSYADAVPAGFPGSVRVVGDTQQSFEARTAELLPRVAAAAGGAPVSILALSGGGAGGAFGAGALVGWSRAGTRPEFQIVTGVSAGALIAPLAFLGPAWDPVLEDAFSGTRTGHLLQRRWLGAYLGSSVYRGEPLAALVDGYVTRALLEAIAAEAARGRMLLVATTDLDTEQTHIWNLTAIASQGGERARRLFRDVLIASASIPGVFPPVLIPVEDSGRAFDELHVDGGTTASLFVAPEIAGFLPDPLTPLRGASLYVIVNGQLGTNPHMTPIGALEIVKRGIAAGMNSGARAELQIAQSFARRNDMSIRATDIPGEYPFSGPLDLRPATMRALFDYGARCALDGRLWSTPLAIVQASARARVAADGGSANCPTEAAETGPAPSLASGPPREPAPARGAEPGNIR